MYVGLGNSSSAQIIEVDESNKENEIEKSDENSKKIPMEIPMEIIINEESSQYEPVDINQNEFQQQELTGRKYL
jgi:hypothetical protein